MACGYCVGHAGIKGVDDARIDIQEGGGRRKGEHTQCGEMARGLREEVTSEWRSEWIKSEP